MFLEVFQLCQWFVLVVLPLPPASSVRGGWMETWPEVFHLQAVLHRAPSAHP